MKKSFKKVLSTILALTMLCSCMAVMNISAFAADSVTVDLTGLTNGATYAENVKIGSSGSLTVAATANGVTAYNTDDGKYIKASGNSDTTSVSVDGTKKTVRNVLKITTAVAGSIVVTVDVNSGKEVCTYNSADTTSYVYYKNSGSEKEAKYAFTFADAKAGTYIFGGIGTDVYVYGVTFTPSSTDPAVAISIDNDSIAVGSTATATVTTSNVDSTATVALTSSDEDVATVDANGKVTGVGAGTATITAAMTYNSTTYTASVDVTVYEMTIDAASALTATAPTSYTGDYTTITTNEDGSVTYSYDFAALAADAIEAGLNPSDTNYNFTIANGVITGGSSVSDLDGDKLYNLSTSNGNLQVVKGSSIEEVKFASNDVSIDFTIGENCTASAVVTTGSSGGAATFTNSDSGESAAATSLTTGNYSIKRSSKLFITKIEITVSAVEDEYIYFGISQDDVDNKEITEYYITDAEGNAVVDINGNEVCGDTVYYGVIYDDETTADAKTLVGTDYVVAFKATGETGDSSDLKIAFR